MIIAVVFWLLFLNGITTIKNLASNQSVKEAPQIIVSGASRAVETIQAPKATPLPIKADLAPIPTIINSSIKIIPIIPKGMPELPTAVATTIPTEQGLISWYATAERQTVVAQQTVQAWLDSPPATDTPWPTATPIPTEYVPTFRAEFKEPPECSPFVGYIGEDKIRCDSFFLTQTATADAN